MPCKLPTSPDKGRVPTRHGYHATVPLSNWPARPQRRLATATGAAAGIPHATPDEHPAAPAPKDLAPVETPRGGEPFSLHRRAELREPPKRRRRFERLDLVVVPLARHPLVAVRRPAFPPMSRVAAGPARAPASTSSPRDRQAADACLLSGRHGLVEPPRTPRLAVVTAQNMRSDPPTASTRRFHPTDAVRSPRYPSTIRSTAPNPWHQHPAHRNSTTVNGWLTNITDNAKAPQPSPGSSAGSTELSSSHCVDSGSPYAMRASKCPRSRTANSTTRTGSLTATRSGRSPKSRRNAASRDSPSADGSASTTSTRTAESHTTTAHEQPGSGGRANELNRTARRLANDANATASRSESSSARRKATGSSSAWTGSSRTPNVSGRPQSGRVSSRRRHRSPRRCATGSRRTSHH